MTSALTCCKSQPSLPALRDRAVTAPPRLRGRPLLLRPLIPTTRSRNRTSRTTRFHESRYRRAQIDFETLGDGTPIRSIALPLALVNNYALQNVAFSFVRADGTPGVGSLCNSRGADPAV